MLLGHEHCRGLRGEIYNDRASAARTAGRRFNAYFVLCEINLCRRRRSWLLQVDNVSRELRLRQRETRGENHREQCSEEAGNANAPKHKSLLERIACPGNWRSLRPNESDGMIAEGGGFR